VDFNLLSIQGSPEIIRQKLQAFTEAEESSRMDVLGELLLSASALAYQHGVDAESALRVRLTRFRTRFAWMEAEAADEGSPLANLNEKEKERLWRQSREVLRSENGE